MKLDHFSVRTPDLEATRHFYEAVLGLRAGARPPFPFPGAWMYAGDTAVVHIIGIDTAAPQGLDGYLGARDEGALKGSGSVDHVAFYADDYAAMKSRLAGLGIEARERSVPDLGLRQLFLEDPNGVVIELNYPQP